MIDAWIQSLEQSGASSDEYLKVSSFINNILNSDSLFRYDVTFLAFWLIQNGKVSSSVFMDLEDKFMTNDPEVVFARVSSPYVYDFSGKRLKYYCESLVGTSEFIRTSCEMLSKRNNLGTMQLPDQPNGDSNLLALYSFIYDKRGNSFKANEFLIESFERQDGKSSPLRFYVQARFCQVNGNYNCAAENWNRALDLNAFAPTALVGLSEAYLETNEIKKAQDFYKKSMQFSKDLVSYHKLSRRMQNNNNDG
jgi:tetratricopeptide (TPR) repeat protein